jgi:hypothetical protein
MTVKRTFLVLGLAISGLALWFGASQPRKANDPGKAGPARPANTPPPALQSALPDPAPSLTAVPLAANPAEYPEFVTRAMDRWPGAAVLSAWRAVRHPQGTRRNVTILQPSDLPYRIRSEEATGRDGRPQRIEMVADHVLAGLEPGVGPANWPADLADEGIQPGQPVGSRGLYRIGIDGDDPHALPRALAVLARHTDIVRYAEPDLIVRALREPNDPRYIDGSLWGLNNPATPDADIAAAEAWEIRTDAAEVVVGIVDSGLRLSHQDLAANLWVNPAETPDGTDSDGNGFIDDLHGINAILLNGDPSDDQGHGSHVAGTIGAVGDNGIGVTGVAWNVRLMGLKFLSSSGGGAASDAILCIEYGIDHGADILNNSWGGTVYSAALHEAVAAARDAGVLFVAAAGNSATDNDNLAIFPALLPVDNVIAVASTDRTDALSAFSNYGQGSVDIAAPGNEILSVGIDADDHYRSMRGTSMAAPHVSGALALLRAEFPGDAPGELVNRLYRGGDPLDALGDGRIATGRRLNLWRSLAEAENRPVNDDFADARLLHGDVVLLRGANHGATSEPGEPALQGHSSPNSVWYTFVPGAGGQTSVRVAPSRRLFDPFIAENITIEQDTIDSVVGVYTGDQLDALAPVASGDGEVIFTAVAGQPYHIAIAGRDDAEGLLMVEVIGPPRNSDIANAIELSINRAITGTNRNALPEAGEPDHAGQTPGASVWFKWTANLTARVGFSTRNSSFNTVAAVYSGPGSGITVGELVPVAANIDAVGATFSRVDFQAIAGTTYYIAVDGFSGAQGTISAILAMAPPNDDFADSTVLSGKSVQRPVNTFFATREPGEPRHLPGRGNGETVWFTWTAPDNDRVTLSSSGSFLPAIIAVYTGNRLDALALVGRDGAGNRPSRVTFDAARGTTYRIAVEAWDWSLVNMPFSLEATPVPPNERFADARVLQGRRTTISGSNAGAGRDPGEPSSNYNGSGSVWYSWTAPASEEIGIYGERMDKPVQRNIVLNVFTGEAVNALTHVKEDFGNGIGRDAFVRWNAVAGRTYHIQVTSLDSDYLVGGEGPFRLDLRPRAEHAPPNDRFPDAIELDGATVYNFRTHNYGASADPGEPAHATLDAAETLWWKFTPGPGQGGRYAVATGRSESSLLTTVYRTTSPDNPTFGSLVEVANNYESASLAFPDIAWEAVEGETYYIVLERARGVRGRVIFHFHKVPDNFVFSGAEVIHGDSARIVTHNWGAVRQPGEPGLGAPSREVGSRSLWWKWTAPHSGRFQLDTIGSETPVSEDNFAHPDRTILGFDTRLGVFTGVLHTQLTQIAVNDSRAPESYGNSWISFQRNSRLEFDAEAGTSYYFLVNGENLDTNGVELEAQTNTGRIRLNLSPLPHPPNDDFSGATEISGTQYHVIQPTFGATREPGEPLHGGINGGRSLWWKWTAPHSGPIVVSTSGNLYDDYHARRTGLGVYTGADVKSLTPIASDQNSAGINTGTHTWSAVRFNAEQGVTYHFGVDAAVAGNLAFILAEPAANDDFADAIEMRGSRWTTTGHNLMSTTEPGEPRVDGGYISEPDNTFRSVWWKWTAPSSGEVSVDTSGSQFLNVVGVFTGTAVGALNPVTPVPKSGGNPFNGDAERRAAEGNNRGPATFAATAGVTYYVSVQGSGFIMPSSGPVVLSLVGPPAIPFAPEDLSALRAGPTIVELRWRDAAVDEEAYIIERSRDNGAWEQLAELPPDAERFTDFAAPADAACAYRVRTRNSVGDSPWITAEWITRLAQWRAEHFNTRDNSGDAADTAAPRGDGVANLLKYAFNMDPARFDNRTLSTDSGAGGLPAAWADADAGGRLAIEFLRRRPASYPGIRYSVEFADDPLFNSTSGGATIRVVPIDPVWERVTIRDTRGGERRYGRVLVQPVAPD